MAELVAGHTRTLIWVPLFFFSINQVRGHPNALPEFPSPHQCLRNLQLWPVSTPFEPQGLNGTQYLGKPALGLIFKEIIHFSSILLLQKTIL